MSTQQPPKRLKEPSFCQRKYDEKQLITFIYYNTVTNRFFPFDRAGIWYSWRIYKGKCNDGMRIAEVNQLDPTIKHIGIKNQWSSVDDNKGQTRA